jgi:hypothetical protein
MIEIFVSKAKKGSSGWAAWTYVDDALLGGNPDFVNDNNVGRLYVEHNNGAIFELCRELVVLGVPDQPWESFWLPRRPSLAGRSIRRAALMTVKENDRGTYFDRWRRFIAAGDTTCCATCGDRYRLFKDVCLACAGMPGAANDNRELLRTATRP